MEARCEPTLDLDGLRCVYVSRHLPSIPVLHGERLAAASGKAIRFPVTGARVFVGRGSIGVRGIRLAKGDKVISMSILDHVAIDVETRDAFLKYAAAQRRGEAADEFSRRWESRSGSSSLRRPSPSSRL